LSISLKLKKMTGISSSKHRFDISQLDSIIIGRVEPSIYAFSTETVPNYLKVGDTYRPVETRLDEWRKYFPNLKKEFQDSARIDEDTLFRDFAVHAFLTEVRKRFRLQPNDFPNIPYYSKEFFKDASIEDVKDAIQDIHLSAAAKDGRYTFYNTDYLPATRIYDRVEDYKPRPNQEEAIVNFHSAVKAGRNNLLLYAVMRFGKSFTSMCCALDVEAKYVIIVSAKADVKEEWKKTVESHVLFADYVFADAESLDRKQKLISSTLAEGKRIVLFLTLQDLQGDEIKKRHAEVFDIKSDLLIIDETHFGARAEKYGKVLEGFGLRKSEAAIEIAGEFGDFIKDGDEETVKKLDTKIRIHLSGTPYRILMSGEFSKEDIIAFCQFSDIVEEQKRWDEEHLLNDEDNNGKAVKEWDNPYFGFPQMIRFAFNPNESSRKRIEELRSEGKSASLSDLLRPASIQKSGDDAHKKFIYEQEVLDLLKVIDGSQEDENILGFLDYDKIKEGKMCRHIVCVLPFRASCDALEHLISSNRKVFKNLSSYEIINIAGVDNENLFPDTASVKSRIAELERIGKKTITLTVNRMLTGSTVEQWDTMLYLKNTTSPQEYDQAIFRLQNQYIQTYKPEGSNEVIKFNMKPQTLLVDFDPARMFELQELRSQFYNINTDKKGNLKLEKRLAKELEISPIIVVNKDKLEEVTPTNILDAIREYSKDKSVLDEAWDIPVDIGLLANDDIQNAIKDLNPIDSSKGLEFKPNEGPGDDFDDPGEGSNELPKAGSGNNRTDTGSHEDKSDNGNSEMSKKLSTYYSMILFFAFLTKSEVKSLDDIINALYSEQEHMLDNRRIANNLGIKLSVLRIIQRRMYPFYLSKLDYKIQNINSLMRDDSLPPLERAERAMKKFGRLSLSEIVTPPFLADDIVSLLPINKYRTEKFLDLASKQGEFACALYKRFGESAKDSIVSLPTSRISYELTRKIYEMMGMPVCNVIDSFVTYDLLTDTNKTEILKNMTFDAIVGNPPYQLMDGGAQSSAKPIYNIFVDIVKSLNPAYFSMITPARWYSGGKGLDDFRNRMLNDSSLRILHDYPDASECFTNVEIKGGVCYYLWDRDNHGKCKVISHENGIVTSSVERALLIEGCDVFIRYNEAISIIDKIRSKSEQTFDTVVSARKPFGLPGNFSDYRKTKNSKHNLKIYAQKAIGYVAKEQLLKGFENIPKWKIFMPEAIGSGQMGSYKLKPILGEPNTVSTETYVMIYPSDSKEICQNVISYINTKFFHFLLSLKKITQHTTSKEYIFIPIQDFTHSWTDDMLFAKYGLSDNEINFINNKISF